MTPQRRFGPLPSNGIIVPIPAGCRLLVKFSRPACTPSPAICNATGQRSQKYQEILFLDGREVMRAKLPSCM